MERLLRRDEKSLTASCRRRRRKAGFFSLSPPPPLSSRGGFTADEAETGRSPRLRPRPPRRDSRNKRMLPRRMTLVWHISLIQKSNNVILHFEPYFALQVERLPKKTFALCPPCFREKKSGFRRPAVRNSTTFKLKLSSDSNFFWGHSRLAGALEHF